jgi:hypothetical protein
MLETCLFLKTTKLKIIGTMPRFSRLIRCVSIITILLGLVNLYNSFQLRKEEKSLFLISHGPFLSIYDLEDKRWDRHLKFDDDIMKLFSYNPTEENSHGKKTVSCVILNNGEIYLDVISVTSN